jgi:hypothetical protein
MAFPPHSGPRTLIQFRIHFSQKVGFLGRVMSQSQGGHLNKRQCKHRINAHTHTPNIHALSGVRTHDPNARASENSLCPRHGSYCDRQWKRFNQPYILMKCVFFMRNTKRLTLFHTRMHIHYSRLLGFWTPSVAQHQ